jgi:hypothetical protein
LNLPDLGDELPVSGRMGEEHIIPFIFHQLSRLNHESVLFRAVRMLVLCDGVAQQANATELAVALVILARPVGATHVAVRALGRRESHAGVTFSSVRDDCTPDTQASRSLGGMS